MSSVRTIEQSDAVLAHLTNCAETLYAGFGSVAPSLGSDACVVVAYDLGRTFGEIRHAGEELFARRANAPAMPIREVGVLADVLRAAVDADPSGSLLVLLFATEIGPRLLVTLRDVREESSLVSEGPLRAFAEHASYVIVSATQRASVTPLTLPETGWRTEIRRFVALFEAAGYAESFGVALNG